MIVTAREWSIQKRMSPAQAYWDLVMMTRRKEAKMRAELRGFWARKWSRRINTRFEIKEASPS